MVELANRIQVAPWFNMPHTADDQYIEEFATLVRDRLNSDLPVYLEYSNETWNGIFPQASWVRTAGAAAFNTNANAIAGANWHGRRTVELCRIWEQVWGAQSDRIICVNASQANPGGGIPPADRVLACSLWNEGPCNDQNGIDAIAIAPYFAGYIGRGSTTQTVTDWTNETDGGLNSLFTEIFSGNGLSIAGALHPVFFKKDVRFFMPQSPLIDLAA